MIYEQVLSEHRRLQKEISTLEKQLETFPSGKLICTRSSKYFKWIYSDGYTHTYIPKKQRAYAEQLAIKKFLSERLNELKHEKTAIEFYLRHHDTSPSKAEQLLSDTSGFQELLTPYFKPLSEELSSWMFSPFESNPLYPEQLLHKTVSGNQVRSKSEALIDMYLYIHKIPFRYESALFLGELTIYPDFTIRHPQTGEYYYWEHFGMMDDDFYCKNACSKLQLYASHGIIPSIHLITTYETKDNPLTTEVIEKTIMHYFL